jgi:hypothetical protein
MVLDVRRGVQEQGGEMRPGTRGFPCENVGQQVVEEHRLAPGTSARRCRVAYVGRPVGRRGVGQESVEQFHQRMHGNPGLRVVVDSLGDGFVQAAQHGRSVDPGGRPGIRHEERWVTQTVVSVHRTDRTDSQSALFQAFPDLGQIVVHDVAQAENTVLRERLAGVRRDPLYPGLELLVTRFRLSHRKPVLVEQVRERGQASLVRVGAHKIEIDLVQLEKNQ